MIKKNSKVKVKRVKKRNRENSRTGSKRNLALLIDPPILEAENRHFSWSPKRWRGARGETGQTGEKL